MNVTRIIAVFLGLTGVAFFLQGTGVFTVIPSIMNNDIRWAAVGALMVAGALWLWKRG